MKNILSSFDVWRIIKSRNTDMSSSLEIQSPALCPEWLEIHKLLY